MENYSVPDSAPVSVVVLGVENLERSLQFYSGTLGLDCIESMTWQGPEFERHWDLPAGSSAECALLGHGADPVGRIQIMAFDAAERKTIRPSKIRRATGLFDLSVYTSDIFAHYEQLKAQGFEFWSEPVRHDFGPDIGAAQEVAFDGPDGIVINLIQFITEDPGTTSGKLLAFLADYGHTRTGFTAVATTAHGVQDMNKALAFYYGPARQTLFTDNLRKEGETNRSLGLPEDAVTRSVVTQGGHEFGKVALSSPVNYELPSLVPDAQAPNIGYLAQSFQVNDLNQSANACIRLDVKIIAGPEELILPGRGLCRAMMTRNPGSGALQEIFQQIHDN